MTNNPAYPQQLEMVKKYDALNVDKDNSLTGMPGGFDSPERFARSHLLAKFLPLPSSTQEALSGGLGSRLRFATICLSLRFSSSHNEKMRYTLHCNSATYHSTSNETCNYLPDIMPSHLDENHAKNS
jgi:penicillin V acylase-like amidase (Ntn superfamily)